MLDRSGFYVHEKSMDVFYEIFPVYKGPKYIKIKYYTWNKNEFGEPFKLFPYPMKAKIMKSEWSKWKKINPLKR